MKQKREYTFHSFRRIGYMVQELTFIQINRQSMGDVVNIILALFTFPGQFSGTQCSM